jgi:glyoxylase-like metal-dependent hydrolase (beta-lactamase superfamily II)
VLDRQVVPLAPRESVAVRWTAARALIPRSEVSHPPKGLPQRFRARLLLAIAVRAPYDLRAAAAPRADPATDRGHEENAMQELTPHVVSLHVDLKWFPQPYPPNVFLIRDGGEAALIDAGFGDDESFNARMAFLAEAGVTQLKYIIITHHHYDHSSGAQRLRLATGAQIVLHTAEEPLLLNPSLATEDMEIPEDQKEAREQAKKWMEEAAKAVPDVRVNDGDVLRVGALHLRCVHAPGHTAGHLCILLEEDGLIFAGDNVLGVGTGVVSDMAEYIRSLRKMQSVEAALLAPGHGPLVKEPNRKLQELIDHRQQREDQILGLVKQGKDSVKALLKAIYPELDKRLNGMATSQIVAHLHKLKEEGKVTLDGKGADMTVAPTA